MHGSAPISNYRQQKFGNEMESMYAIRQRSDFLVLLPSCVRLPPFNTSVLLSVAPLLHLSNMSSCYQCLCHVSLSDCVHSSLAHSKQCPDWQTDLCDRHVFSAKAAADLTNLPIKRAKQGSQSHFLKTSVSQLLIRTLNMLLTTLFFFFPFFAFPKWVISFSTLAVSAASLPGALSLQPLI